MDCSAYQISPLKYEKDMPAYQELLPHIVITNEKSWGKLQSDLLELVSKSLSNSKKIKSFAKRLVGESKSEEDKLRKIHRFVAQDIRYIGIEHGKRGIIPKMSEKTLSDKYGDCKEKTMLFLDLVKSVGLNAFPVLTSTRRYHLEKFLAPSIKYFNHMIACVELNGQQQCVDLTDPDTPLGYLYELNGAVALNLNNSGRKLYKLPERVYPLKINVTTKNELYENGIMETQERSYAGTAASLVRTSLKRQTKDERNSLLTDWYNEAVSKSAKPLFKYSGLNSIDEPVVIKSTTKFEWNNKKIDGYSDLDYWLRDTLRYAKTDNKLYYFSVEGVSYKSIATYDFYNGGSLISIGPFINYESEFGSFTRSYHLTDNGGINVKTELKIPTMEIPVSKIPMFNKFINLVSREKTTFSLRENATSRKQILNLDN